MFVLTLYTLLTKCIHTDRSVNFPFITLKLLLYYHLLFGGTYS